MTSSPSLVELDANLDGRLRLDELVNRDALGELCTSFYDLFGIPVRIYSSEGALLADVSSPQELCAYVNVGLRGRAACASVVGAVKHIDPGFDGDVVHPCFTGAAYRVIGIDYEGRRIGRLRRRRGARAGSGDGREFGQFGYGSSFWARGLHRQGSPEDLTHEASGPRPAAGGGQ